MKHKHYEALRTLIAAPKEQLAKAFTEYASAFTTTRETVKSRPSNLLDLYLPDVRHLLQDLERRPDHYDARSKEIIEELAKGATTATDQEKNALLMLFMEHTVPKKVREKRKPAEDDTVLENGQTIDGAVADLIFERQSSSDKTII